MLIEQHKGYALGNFIMITPTIKKLSEINNKPIDVYFNHDYVKQCFIDCQFINIVNNLYEKPYLSSSMINKEIPDYQYVFNKTINENWTQTYHTYVDQPVEFDYSGEDYLLLLNGLGGLSLNDSEPKPHWYGKKEITEDIFYMIKEKSKLPIYFTGSESDLKQNPWINEIATKIEIGDVRKALALIRDAKLIISNDTGLAHCAGAMNKNILILWKDTPFIKNKNPGINTIYSMKENWVNDINSYLTNGEYINNINNLYFLIPSYNRYDKLSNLITQITNKTNANIIIYNDGSTDDRYYDIENSFKNTKVIHNVKNNGKENYKTTILNLLTEGEKTNGDYFILIADDFILCESFIDKLKPYLNNSHIVNIFSLIDKNWGYKSWIDGAFSISKNGLTYLKSLIPYNIKTSEGKSTGLWKHITKVINDKSMYKILTLNYSLTQHDGNDDSKLHPKHRLIQPIIAHNFYDDFYGEEIKIISTSGTVHESNNNIKKKSSEGTSNGDKNIKRESKDINNESKIKEAPTAPKKVVINTPIATEKPNIKKEVTPEKMQKPKTINKTHGELFMGKAMKKKLRFGRK